MLLNTAHTECSSAEHRVSPTPCSAEHRVSSISLLGLKILLIFNQIRRVSRVFYCSLLYRRNNEFVKFGTEENILRLCCSYLICCH